VPVLRGLRQRRQTILRVLGIHVDWEVDYILDMCDPSVPHISCFLADDALLRDDCLSTSELRCALSIMAGRLRHRRYSKHRLVPVRIDCILQRSSNTNLLMQVTVFSAASRQLRVIQAYYDSQQEYIVVRKSKILDFEPENRDTTKLVLQWMIGDPTGETTYEKWAKNAAKNQQPIESVKHWKKEDKF